MPKPKHEHVPSQHRDAKDRATCTICLQLLEHRDGRWILARSQKP